MSTNNIYFHGEIRKHIYLSFPLIRSFVNDKIGLHIRAVWWRFGCPLTDCLATVEHRGFAKRKCVLEHSQNAVSDSSHACAKCHSGICS